jgi:hypothetical protein
MGGTRDWKNPRFVPATALHYKCFTSQLEMIRDNFCEASFLGFLLTYRRSVHMKRNFAVLAIVAALSTAPLMASAADAGSTGSSAPAADTGTPKKTTKHHHHKKSSKSTSTAGSTSGSK